MLLKQPEKTTKEAQRDRKVMKKTLVVCIIVLLFFAARFYHVWDRAKNLKVVVDSVGAFDSILPVADVGQVVNTTSDTLQKSVTDILHATVVPGPGHEVGIAAGSKLNGMSEEAIEEYMLGLKALGVKWVRFDIEWGFVQYSSKDTYDWARYDRIVNSVHKHNMKAVAILTYTPEWARTPGCGGGAHCPPHDPKEFAVFAAAAVNRYKSKGLHHWEIWNEPNSYDFWATKSDCVAYTNLLKATYPAIKKADPFAFVITGGVAPIATTDVNIAPLEFIQCIYEQKGKNYFDAIGYHPYTFPRLVTEGNTNAWSRLSITTPSARSIMESYGDSAKRIWITEFGAPTGGPDPAWYMTEERQAALVSDTMSQYVKYNWMGPIFWYSYKDSGNTPSTNENHFGLVRFDGTFKPAYHTMQEILSKKL
jgi:polysaccharide biosynthesis protein PslG